MGHLLISCGRCHDEVRSTTFYEPPTTSHTARSMKDLPAGEMNEVTWVGVSGSWRYVLPGLRDAVHKEVTTALAAGKSIVTGGTLGTDYWPTETCSALTLRG